MEVTRTPDVAILDHLNGALSQEALFRDLLAHPTWFAGGHRNRTFAWMSSRDVATPDLMLRDDFVGVVEKVERIADWVANLDQVSLLKLEPAGPISLALDGPAIEAFRRVARVVQLERDVAARDLARVRTGTYYVVLVEDQLVGVSSERGDLIASFTSPGSASEFIRERAPERTPATKLVCVSGETLFGEVADAAAGIVIDVLAPRFLTFDRAGCADMLAMLQ